MYSDLYLRHRGHVTKGLVGLALVVSMVAVMFGVSQDASPTRASRKTLVTHEAVNTTPTQIGVFWEVETSDEGWVIYGTNPDTLDLVAGDERDGFSGVREKRRYHYVLLRNLLPDTVYYYKIITDNELISRDDGGAFEVRTLPQSTYSSSLSPIYGKVLLPAGTPARGVFAMVLIGNAAPLIGLTSSTGEWLVPLQYVVHKETGQPLSLTDTMPYTVQFFDDVARSMVRSTFDRSRPIPEQITLGSNYTFVSDDSVLSAQTNDESGLSRGSEQLSIQFPKDRAVIPGTAPIIKGFGIPGSVVRIALNARPSFQTQLVVDDEGRWDVPIRFRMSPGTYVLQVDGEDSRGKLTTVKRSFTIAKSGERVLGESTATPSGTLAPTRSAPTPTATPQPTPSRSLSPTPPENEVTPEISPSPTPGTILEISPAPSPAPIQPTPPVSGVSLVPVVITGLGMMIMGIGVILLL